MSSEAHFQVDPRLATLLGENYRSVEHAVKELVDNAWDADAANVWITLPEPMTDDPIIVRDNGSGMTEKEVRQEYLFIANDRLSRKGERSPKGRPVKGRKGIGKFAGLVAAEIMVLETLARGRCTRLRIAKRDILSGQRDLERVPLPIEAKDCDPSEHGTTITLSELSQKLSFPTPPVLRQLLVLEYGRQEGFTIRVNDEQLAHDDIPGEKFSVQEELPEVGKVRFSLTIMDTPKGRRVSGVVLRVGGKVVGKPGFYGLDENEDIPRKLLDRVYGEIEADGLEDDVTADWGAIIENSKALQQVKDCVQRHLTSQVERAFSRELSLVKARREKEIKARLAALPENRRDAASAALDRVLKRFYGEAEEKIDVLVSLVLDAFEKDDYWTVCQRVAEARHADVTTFADALESFGLVDLAIMAQQAQRRLQILDDLEDLIRREDTLEKTVHKALEHNLWVLGSEYSLMASNQTLAKTMEEYTSQKFKGARADKRPDLLLAENVLRQHLLIEFKRPSHTLTRDDENQAEKYRDDLTPGFGTIAILVIGGNVDPNISAHYKGADIKLLSYASVLSNARTQLNWLLSELGTGRDAGRAGGTDPNP